MQKVTAMMLFNAGAEEPDPRKRAELAGRIGELLEQCDDPEIALIQAKAIVNATIDEPDYAAREALAARTGALLERYDSLDMAVVYAHGLYWATAFEPYSRHVKKLSDEMYELEYSPDAVLAHLKETLNSTLTAPDVRRIKVLARRIGELLERYDDAAIAVLYARALANVARLEKSPRRMDALARRIAEISARYHSPEIAAQHANTLETAAEQRAHLAQTRGKRMKAWLRRIGRCGAGW